MTSSKKKRGKQRKAAAKGGALAANIFELVRKGDSYATYKVMDTTNSILLDNLSVILLAVFGLLQRCENETFDDVMADVGGDLRSPSNGSKFFRGQ